MSNNSVGNINLDLNLNSKGFNKQLSGIKGTALKAGKAMAAAFTIKAVANFSKQCLELGSNLAEVQNVVDVTFGGMSEKVNRFAQEAATAYGLSETMAKKYTGTFGAMANAFGITGDEAYDMSTKLTGLAGDVASFYNLSQDEAYTKLKSVFTGETESLKDLGVVMTQTALDQYALAKGFGKTTAAMSEAEKVSLRYAFVVERLNAADGDFGRTAKSWANQVRMLSLQFESFKAAIGQGLINVLTPAIQWLNVLMQKCVAAANAFKNFTETLFGKSDAGTKNTADTATVSAENVTDATNTATEATKKLKRELAGFDQITKLGSEDSSGDNTTPSSTTTTTTGSNYPTPDNGTAEKLATLAEKYKNLATAIGNLKDKFKTFTDLLKGAGKWVYDNVLKPLGNWTMNKLLPTYLDTLASAFGLVNSVCKLLKPVWQWVWDNFLSKVANYWGGKILTFLENLGNFFDLVTIGVDSFKTAISNLPEKIDSIRASIKEKWEKVKSCITGKIVDFKAKIATKWAELKEKWNNLKKNIADKTASFKAKVATKWADLKEAWNNLKKNIADKTASFKAKVATKWSELKEKWNKLKDNATGKTADIKAKIASKWSDLKNAWNNLLGNFKDKKVSVTLNIAGKVADIKKWFNESVIDKVNDQIHQIGILKGVSIPHLAQGGFVKKNTPQLAMIGDNRHYGEIVAPENKLQEMARMAAAGAGGTSPEVIALLREIVELLKALDLDVTIDGNSLMQLIVRLINQQTKSTGKCPVMV